MRWGEDFRSCLPDGKKEEERAPFETREERGKEEFHCFEEFGRGRRACHLENPGQRNHPSTTWGERKHMTS